MRPGHPDRRVMPPAAWMWLSLIRMPSARLKRWLLPPPTRTAYFSRIRRPGVVLRVSVIRAPGAGDLADSPGCLRGDAGQTLQEIQGDPLAGQDARAGPCSGRAGRRAGRRRLQPTRNWIEMAGSSKANTRLKTGRPQIRPSSLAIRRPLTRVSGADDGLGGDVAGADIFGQCLADNRIDQRKIRKKEIAF